MQRFIHEAAPDMLLTKIAELRGIITKHRAKNVNADMSFYDDMIKVMQFSYQYMRELSHLVDRNQFLEYQVYTLRKLCSELQLRVDEIDIVAKLDAENRLEEVLEQSRQYTDKVLSIRELMNKKNEKQNGIPA